MVAFRNDIPFVASPNFSGRGGADIRALIVHYTAGGKGSNTIRQFATEGGVSAHFVISRDGRITQMVGLDYKAWHAGASELVIEDEGSFSDANRYTIGIELANWGLMRRDENGQFWAQWKRKEVLAHPVIPPMEGELTYDNGYAVRGWWEPFPEEQIDALDWLIKRISEDRRYKRAVDLILGHESIAMPFGRKSDPGPLFPWSRFGGWKRQRTNGAVFKT